ncbi:ABC transporter permease subunit, partial [Rhizobium ruizarguesonis]
LELAAQMLGASRVSFVRHVIVPLSVPGIFSSLLLSFTMAASAYATPALLGGKGPVDVEEDLLGDHRCQDFETGAAE